MNVTGPIILFQAVYDLLKKSDSPRFVPISSIGGCLDGTVIRSPIGSVAYGATKAALNWTTRKIHFENDWLGTRRRPTMTPLYIWADRYPMMQLHSRSPLVRSIPICVSTQHVKESPRPYIDLIPVRIAVESDKSGALQKLVEDDVSENLPTAETVSVSLVKIIDESTRENEGGQFVHVDGTRLGW